MTQRWFHRTTALMTLGGMLMLTACSSSTPPASSQPAAPAASGSAPAAAQPQQQQQQPAAPGQPKAGGTLIVATEGDPPTLDWATSTTMAARQVGYHVFEQLFTFNDKYEVIPQLAESYTTSPDGKVYTIKLRKGVKFHNGDEMKAEDVKVSVDRFIEVNPRKGEVAAFKEIRVKDDYTVELELKEAQGAFLYAFSMPVPGAPIMPAKLTRGVAATKLTVEQLVGTGPFMLKEWVAASHVKLVKFKDYVPDARYPGPLGLGGKRTAYVDEVILKPVKEPAARLAGLEAGDYHFAEGIPPSDYERISKNTKLKAQVLSPWWWIAMMFNVTKPPFDNVKLRQAVLVGLDQEEIMLAVAERKEFYRLDSSLYFKEQVWHNDMGTKMGLYNQKDLARAKQLLQEGSYKGEKVRILTNTTYDWMYKASQVAAEQMKKIGFNVELVVLDWPTVNKVNKDMQAWEIYYTGNSPRFDPSGFGYMLQSGKSNVSGYNSQKMDQLLLDGLKEADVAKRQKIYEEAAKLWYEDIPQIKHGDYHGLHGHLVAVQGYTPWYSIRFWDVWLNQ